MQTVAYELQSGICNPASIKSQMLTYKVINALRDLLEMFLALSDTEG